MQILRLEAAARKVGVSVSAFRKLVKTGHLPAPIEIAQGMTGWRDSDLDVWIAERPLICQAQGKPSTALTVAKSITTAVSRRRQISASV